MKRKIISFPNRRFLLDKHGREIMVGDTLKIWHFKSSSRTHYMYKFVEARIPAGSSEFFQISHLSTRSRHYHDLISNVKRNSVEIVQGYGDDGTPFDQRPRYMK